MPSYVAVLISSHLSRLNQHPLGFTDLHNGKHSLPPIQIVTGLQSPGRLAHTKKFGCKAQRSSYGQHALKSQLTGETETYFSVGKHANCCKVTGMRRQHVCTMSMHAAFPRRTAMLNSRLRICNADGEVIMLAADMRNMLQLLS